MSKKVQDYLFILFVVLFIILTISISLYASGYKLTLHKPISLNRILVKTGTLVIDTIPDNANIYLSKQIIDKNLIIGKKKKITTPAIIKNLLPGKYKIIVNKPKYWPIQKIIYIKSGQTSFIKNLSLFKNNKPLTINADVGKKINTNKNYRYLFIPEKKDILNLKTNKINKTDTNTNWKWINNKLIINGQNINLETGKITNNIFNILTNTPRKWTLNNNGSSLYYLDKGVLNEWSINNKTNTILLKNNNLIDYIINKNNIFTLSNVQTISTLIKYDKFSRKKIKTIILNRDGDYQIISNKYNWISIYDNKHKTLYLFNNNLSLVHKIPALSWQWINDNTIIYTNGYNIYKLDIKNNQKKLLTRLSIKINKLLYNPPKGYLLIIHPKSIQVIDTNVYIITTLLTEKNTISDAQLDKQKDILYFNIKQNNHYILYKMLVK